jgi:hypothetical protein
MSNAKQIENMKTTVNKLELGDRLSNSKPSEFGYYKNIIVVSIRTTKTNRYVIETDSQFVYPDGKVTEAKKSIMYNSVVGHTETELF